MRMIILICLCLLVIGTPYVGILYEGYMLRNNSRALVDDVIAMNNRTDDYVPKCTMYYNPVRFWEDRDRQRARYRNSTLLCED